MQRFVTMCLAIIAFTLPLTAQPKYGVTVTADKTTDFTKFKTYAWQGGWEANDKKVHALIVAAVDREMKALGFELKSAGPTDVRVKYAALRRIDVQANTNRGQLDAPRGQVDVGSLQILMLDPVAGKELLRMRFDRAIEVSPDKIEATVNGAVAEIFAQYPTRTKKK